MKLRISERGERKIWKSRINDTSSQNRIGFHGAIQSFLCTHITNPTSIKITRKCQKCRGRYFGSSLCSVLISFIPLLCILPAASGPCSPPHMLQYEHLKKKSKSLRKVTKNKTKLGINRHGSLTLRSASKSVLLKSVFKDHREMVTNHLPFSSTSSYGSGTMSSPGAESAPTTGLSQAWETRQASKWVYRGQEELRCNTVRAHNSEIATKDGYLSS